MRVPFLGWRFVGPDGARGEGFRSAREAAEAALRKALAARWDPKLDAETKRRLWRSLRSKGWYVEEVRPS